MSDFAQALRWEMAELERSLESDPRYIKLRELQRIASLYRAGGSSLHLNGSFHADPQANASTWSPVARQATFTPSTAGGGSAREAADERPAATAEVATPVVLPPPATRRHAAAMRDAILKDVVNMLEGRTKPTRTAEIYEMVKLIGYELGGKDPRNNLSALMSKSQLFTPHGKNGWTLRPQEAQDEEPRDTEEERLAS